MIYTRYHRNSNRLQNYENKFIYAITHFDTQVNGLAEYTNNFP